MAPEQSLRPEDVSIVFFREENLWIAQAVEVDVCTHGRTKAEARQRMATALLAEEDVAVGFGKRLEDLPPPPGWVYLLMGA